MKFNIHKKYITQGLVMYIVFLLLVIYSSAIYFVYHYVYIIFWF